LGEGRAITGTWRNGYVELSFGALGPVSAFLAGWIEGGSGKGSDGSWMARRRGSYVFR